MVEFTGTPGVTNITAITNLDVNSRCAFVNRTATPMVLKPAAGEWASDVVVAPGYAVTVFNRDGDKFAEVAS